MEIIHVVAECYPVAKAGGPAMWCSLPKYRGVGTCGQGGHAMYRTKFSPAPVELEPRRRPVPSAASGFTTALSGRKAINRFDLTRLISTASLDRERIYGYDDDKRNVYCLQIAVQTG